MSVCRAAFNLITRDKRESTHTGVRHFARSLTWRAVDTGESALVTDLQCDLELSAPLIQQGVLVWSFEEVSVEMMVGFSISYVPCPAASARLEQRRKGAAHAVHRDGKTR